MRSYYILIKKAQDNYQYFLNFTSDESSVPVYFNGLRLFSDKDYTIIDRMVTTLNISVKLNDLIIISHS